MAAGMDKGTSFLDLGDGVTLSEATQADFDHINANLRDGDRAEQRVFGDGFRDGPELYDRHQCWTIRDGGATVGFVALQRCGGDGPLSRRRLLCMLTTRHVDRVKVKFVRCSRRVLRAVAEMAPSWVTEFLTLPMKSYEGAVRWDERVLGFRRVMDVSVNGVEHVLLAMSREEALR